MIQEIIRGIQSELIDAFSELNSGVQTSGGSGSFSATLQIVRAKKGRFKASVKCRVRTPREPLEIDMHLDESGQLSLGLPASWESDGEDDGDSGGGDLDDEV